MYIQIQNIELVFTHMHVQQEAEIAKVLDWLCTKLSLPINLSYMKTLIQMHRFRTVSLF